MNNITARHGTGKFAILADEIKWNRLMFITFNFYWFESIRIWFIVEKTLIQPLEIGSKNEKMEFMVILRGKNTHIIFFFTWLYCINWCAVTFQSCSLSLWMRIYGFVKDLFWAFIFQVFIIELVFRTKKTPKLNSQLIWPQCKIWATT